MTILRGPAQYRRLLSLLAVLALFVPSACSTTASDALQGPSSLGSGGAAGRGGMNIGGVSGNAASGQSAGGALGLSGNAGSGTSLGGAFADPSAAGGPNGGASSAGAPGGGALGNAGAPAAIVAPIAYSTAQQSIDGFGIATAWGSVPPDALLDAFFSVSKGAGLSIVRNRIPFREAPSNDDNFMGGGSYAFTSSGAGATLYKTFTLNWNNWDLSATRTLIGTIKRNSDYAVASYFSTPWTPPNNNTSRWKLGVADYVNKPEVGGFLDPAHYADYADVLADYALGFEAKMGAPLTALSLQNEPNYKADYESADWSGAQFHSFLLVLKSEFTKKGVFAALPKLMILAPEDPNFKEDLVLPTLADSSTAALIGIVGVHQYEFGPSNAASYAPPLLTKSLAAGKKIWMTEWNTSALTNASPFVNALTLAGLIHLDFTAANLSAYVHWWYHDLVGTDGTPNKNLWVLGQFSRFVRPGWSRVNAPATVASNVLLSAFRDPGGKQLVAVAINRGNNPVTFALTLDSGNFGTVTAYRTSATEDMANVGTSSGSGHFVNVSVAPLSVTTFVAPLTP